MNFLRRRARVDRWARICFHAAVKIFLFGAALALLATSCTTLSNRRDLYNPSEDAGPYQTLPPAHPGGPKPATPNLPEEALPPAPQ